MIFRSPLVKPAAPEGGRRLQAHHRLPVPPCRSASPSSPYQSASSLSTLNKVAKEKVLNLVVAAASGIPDEADLFPAVSELIQTCPIPKDELSNKSFVLGQGTWEVFTAPHISRMSSILGTKFQPIRYCLFGERITSNVKYSHPMFGSGWLSAAGTMSRKYDDSVEINFHQFWIDGPETLRVDIPSTTLSSPGGGLDIDSVISTLGRSAFFPQLAIFPILYLDEDMCVFEFPVLSSKIGVRKIPEGAAGLLDY